MGRTCILLALGALSIISVADIFTLSVGDINQYSASLVSYNRQFAETLYGLMKQQAATPTLTGSRMLFTDAPSPNGGVDVLLSEELRTNIQKSIDDNCNTINPQCVDSVRGLLVNPHTELESRQLAEVVVGVAGLIALVSLTIPLWEDRNQGVPVALHMPPAQLEAAGSAANAATMAAVTGSGAPFITIVATPTAGYEYVSVSA
jgi:hypothetical protein